jgi:hypothetical protein
VWVLEYVCYIIGSDYALRWCNQNGGNTLCGMHCLRLPRREVIRGKWPPRCLFLGMGVAVFVTKCAAPSALWAMDVYVQTPCAALGEEVTDSAHYLFPQRSGKGEVPRWGDGGGGAKVTKTAYPLRPLGTSPAASPGGGGRKPRPLPLPPAKRFESSPHIHTPIWHLGTLWLRQAAKPIPIQIVESPYHGRPFQV